MWSKGRDRPGKDISLQSCFSWALCERPQPLSCPLFSQKIADSKKLKTFLGISTLSTSSGLQSVPLRSGTPFPHTQNYMLVPRHPAWAQKSGGRWQPVAGPLLGLLPGALRRLPPPSGGRNVGASGRQRKWRAVPWVTCGPSETTVGVITTARPCLA